LQNHRQLTLFEKDLRSDSDSKGKPISSFTIDLLLNASELGLVQGPATLLLEARDLAWRRWLRGNRLVREFPVQVILVPPRMNVLSKNIYINRGGTGLVLYRVNESAVNSGIRLGNYFYPSFAPWPQEPDLRLCYFAFADTLPRNTQVLLSADDGGGNQVQQNLSVQVRWRDFDREQIGLSDNFLQQVAAKAAEFNPEAMSGLEAFKWIYEVLRARSSEHIDAAINAGSASRQLWRGSFLRPLGKVMSGFIEQRSYLYKGAVVGNSTHYGLDIANVAQSPVRASAEGRVIFAAEAGVYGNCIIIDHGFNLFTLYAHLSELQVQKDDNVTMGQQIGLSGTTGFSFGDHLHFSCMIGGTFVTPYEWWDPKWIADNVELRFKEAGVSPPH
jgi:murein DD-endopeptidase MepM/ murein hydrolase activator NlpD